ncbi:hypothetical protein KHC33_01335 [Methanospirillum sp. J.3.6.1-F.2.7.3]|uniref:Uncharacterized protein n=1 Tax=Methanospirillum purgamenti TaxID=2834276 RepID=A0A8E7B2F5_9EURY|nr:MULTISPECIES: hypothetical protein [Methanospirillum]MDX8549510.1 hypothetical protein [Methanospirillum hungatei]QVV89207.1 hypothetical protein KHC33_01335 [Methanospirillum sp. J.3.6.1-F.2.7.3]
MEKDFQSEMNLPHERSVLYVYRDNNSDLDEIIFERVNLNNRDFEISFILTEFSDIHRLTWVPAEHRICNIFFDFILIKEFNRTPFFYPLDNLRYCNGLISLPEFMISNIEHGIDISFENKIQLIEIVFKGRWYIRSAEESLFYINGKYIEAQNKIDDYFRQITNLNQQLESHNQEIQSYILNNNNLQQQQKSHNQEIQSYILNNNNLQQQVERKNREIQDKTSELQNIQMDLLIKNQQIFDLTKKNECLEQIIDSIEKSITWNFIQIFHQKVIEKCLSQGTRRRKIYDFWLHFWRERFLQGKKNYTFYVNIRNFLNIFSPLNIAKYLKRGVFFYKTAYRKKEIYPLFFNESKKKSIEQLYSIYLEADIKFDNYQLLETNNFFDNLSSQIPTILIIKRIGSEKDINLFCEYISKSGFSNYKFILEWDNFILLDEDLSKILLYYKIQDKYLNEKLENLLIRGDYYFIFINTSILIGSYDWLKRQIEIIYKRPDKLIKNPIIPSTSSQFREYSKYLEIQKNLQYSSDKNSENMINLISNFSINLKSFTDMKSIRLLDLLTQEIEFLKLEENPLILNSDW